MSEIAQVASSSGSGDEWSTSACERLFQNPVGGRFPSANHGPDFSARGF